jgi:hypothetical protein
LITCPRELLSVSISAATPLTVTDWVACPTGRIKSTRWRALTVGSKGLGLGVLKTAHGHAHAVGAKALVDEFVIAVGVGCRLHGDAGLHIDQRDGGGIDHRLVGVMYPAQHDGRVKLCRCQRGGGEGAKGEYKHTSSGIDESYFVFVLLERSG